MNLEERGLIESVFDRLEKADGEPKDAEALALIRKRAQALPDSAYGLVQAVLVQEMALNQAQHRIAGLERQIAEARGAQPSGSPGFLPAGAVWAGSSVPNTGAAPLGPQPQTQPQPPAQPPAQPQPQPGYQPGYASAPPLQPGPWSSGGGFLRNAAGMAAGVAGGSLLAQGIASLFHPHWLGGMGGMGGFGGAGYGPWGGMGGMPGGNVENVTINNYGDGQNTPQDAGFQDPSIQDAGFQDDSSGGFDDSSDI